MHDSRTGVALMLAVWVLLVLGFASLQVLAQVRGRVDVATVARTQTVARYAAESGVVAARALLEELVQGADSPEAQARVFGEFQRIIETWGVQELRSARYQVVVEDLNARVDLNESREEVLHGLFRQFVGDARAAELLDALWGWGLEGEAGQVQPVETPEASADEALLRASVADRPPLMHLEELALMQGFDEALVAELAPYVTVRGDGLVNVNSAPLPVLTASPDVGPVAARTLTESRDQEGLFDSKVGLLSVLREASAGELDSQLPDLVTAPRRVLVVARGWEEGRPASHEVQAVLEVQWSRMIVGERTRLRAWGERSR
ncbi:MAG: general secretion pathway protein GspK [Gemmatimonadales bacterium]|nr:MAG: general secretion pathway protein GspK [Gemmatimonadales bacterium]